MFSLYGPENSVRNAYKLAHRYLQGRRVADTFALKPYYLDFLATHQPHQPVNRRPDFFIHDIDNSERLKQAYRHSGLNDLNQQDLLGEAFDPESTRRLEALVRAGYERLASSHPRLKALFDLVIHSIFFRRSRGGRTGEVSFGGSSSTAMGAIWISGHGQLHAGDIAEFLLHELTHHLLFIAERCEPQFVYSQMVLPENFAQSAILNKRRPLDKVVHSIVVSTEILLARRSFLPAHQVTIHPDDQTIERQTDSAIAEVLALKNRDRVLTPWTVELMHRCQAAVACRRTEVAC